MARYLPLGLDLHGTPCVVVGGGRIGTRKAETLLEAGALVTLIAPQVSDRVVELHRAGLLQWLAEPFRAEQLGNPLLVVAATSDPTVNEAVVRTAREQRALVCDASCAERSQLIFGALHRTTDVTLAVFTNGQDPALARRTRDRIAGEVAAAVHWHGGVIPGGSSHLILIAHGSRDPRWRASIEGVVQAVQAQTGAASVSLAYMDRSPPTLQDAADAAARLGCKHLHVLPLFLAPEGHVERDILPLVERARAAHPELTIEFMPPIGQLPAFRRLLCSLALELGALDDPVTPAGAAGAPPRPQEGAKP